MATLLPFRGNARRAARLALAGAALLAAATGASADDGIAGFLASIFGGGPQSAAPAPARSPVPARISLRHRRHGERPLTVRLRPARPRAIAQASAPPGKVSIFEDRTLRRGDAVMMAEGVRIFAGSTSWPYTAGDFVPLREARSLDSGTSKVLAQLDRLPRR